MLQIDLAKITNNTVADPGLQVRRGALKKLPKGSISLPQSCGLRLLLSSKNKGGEEPGAPPLYLPEHHAKQVELHSKTATFVPQPCCYDLSNDILPKYG